MHSEERTRLRTAMAALASGHREAFDDVFALAWPVLRAFAAKLLHDETEAEDAAQRALLKLFSNASRYKSDRDALPWVIGFVVNEVRSIRRRRRRPVPFDEPCTPRSPEDELLSRELSDAMREVVGTLEPRDRKALGLEFSRDDGVAPATRRKRKQRALGRLRTAWRRIHGTA